MGIQIRKLNEDELCHYNDMFKDSLTMYTQLQFDIIPIGVGMYVYNIAAGTRCNAILSLSHARSLFHKLSNLITCAYN